MSFQKRVKKSTIIEGVDSLTMPTNIKDVITISGSFEGGSLYAPKENKQIANLTAAMIDKGTKSRDKYEISNMLDSIGAEINFSSSSNHINFTASCMRKDLDIIIELISEQLCQPAIHKSELDLLKTRILGNLERSKEDTKKQANIALLRKIYSSDHPNFRYTIDEAINLINELSVKDLTQYHNNIFGNGSIRIATVGDFDTNEINSKIEKYFSILKPQTLPKIEQFLPAKKSKQYKESIHIADKTSADVYLGQSISIDQDHSDYIPLMIAIYILGGNFSARLMQTVRDNEGLTYGIGSSISSASYRRDGYWSTWATFSPELLNKGIKSTKKQIDLWNKEGVKKDEVDVKKTTLIGSYKVGMDTTAGLAHRLLANDEKGRTISYLDDYPSIIENISLEEVNKTIHDYIDSANLIEISAGTI